MKKLILFILIFINQHYIYGQFGSLDALPAIIDDIKKISVTIEKMDSALNFNVGNPIHLGSGFLIIKAGKSYVITNSHVVRSATQKEKIIIGINTANKKMYGTVNLIKRDDKRDIAIFEFLGNVFSDKTLPDTIQWQQKNVGVTQIAKNSEIKLGLSVISIGYPLSIGVNKEDNNPVVRLGIIAQELQSNGIFLIDGLSIPGNSGSPVFDIINQKLVGMIFSGPRDLINAFDENGNLVVSLPYNSGLTYCISAEEILKIIP